MNERNASRLSRLDGAGDNAGMGAHAATHDCKRTKLRTHVRAGEMGAVASGARSIWCDRTDGAVAGSTFANDRY